MLRLSIRSLVMLTLVALGAPAVSAHDAFRIIGTLTRVGEFDIEVKSEDFGTVSIKINKDTPVIRDEKPVARSELKKGRSVVVEALGDEETDATAMQIRIVPDIKPARKK